MVKRIKYPIIYCLISRELSFNRGDVIEVYRIIDNNWMEGENNGQIGIFPSSYVQVMNFLLIEFIFTLKQLELLMQNYLISSQSDKFILLIIKVSSR